MLEEYRKHVAERAAMGIVAKPLDATQMAALVELLKNPPAGEEEFLLDLLINRVPPGVDEAAYVKAGFLAAVAKGDTTSPLVSPEKAIELLGTMQGGYNIHPLIDALDAAKDQNLASLVRLALATGMRRGALLALQWDDLDFRTGHITLRGEVAKSGNTSQIPMTAAALVILEGIERTSSPYVFPGKKGGKRVEVRNFTDRIRKVAGLPADFRPLHGLRHTYASWLASSGKVDLFTLQKLMTHGSPQMTQRYAHLADEAMKRAASVIDECLDLAANAEPARPAGAKVTKFKKD